ncbi:hypothetical protein Tco_0128194 [Tanacetum coccineum]
MYSLILGSPASPTKLTKPLVKIAFGSLLDTAYWTLFFVVSCEGHARIRRIFLMDMAYRMSEQVLHISLFKLQNASKIMSSQLVNIKKFSGKSNFSLWKIKIRALLKQQGIWAPIVGAKPADMRNANYKLQEEKAHSTILLCLSDEVLYEVCDEETANGVWKKLEMIYMTNVTLLNWIAAEYGSKSVTS